MKYHVNPETGKVSICRAKVKCRFGGSTGNENHFSSKNAADQSAEGLMATKYSVAKGRTKKDFVSIRDNIKAGLVSSGIIPNDLALPPVNNQSEMIEKWFGGDKKKFDVITRISDPQTTFKENTKKSVGKFVSSGLDVSMSGDSNFNNAPSVLNSDIELIDDDFTNDKIELKDLASGKIKAF